MGPISAYQFAIFTGDVVLSLPKGQKPDDQYRVSYPVAPSDLLGQRGDLLTPDEIGFRDVTLSRDTRPATLMVPGRRIAYRLSQDQAGTLHFCYGYQSGGLEASAGGIRVSEGESDGIGFRLLSVNKGVATELWKAFLDKSQRNRFFDARVVLEKEPAARELVIEAFGSRAGEDRRLDDFGFFGAPTLAPERAADRTNVLIVLIDTLRADALGCYGNPQDLTPNIDRFAERSIRFEKSRSASSWTLPSHASLFTSLLPIEHGLHTPTHSLDEKLECLAEVFQQAGFRTGAFTDGGMVSTPYGLNQGFDRFDYSGKGVTDVTRDALAWLRSRTSPYFCFVQNVRSSRSL